MFLHCDGYSVSYTKVGHNFYSWSRMFTVYVKVCQEHLVLASPEGHQHAVKTKARAIRVGVACWRFHNYGNIRIGLKGQNDVPTRHLWHMMGSLEDELLRYKANTENSDYAV